MKSISQINGKTKTYSLSELIEVINREKAAIASYIKCDVSKVYESITYLNIIYVVFLYIVHKDVQMTGKTNKNNLIFHNYDNNKFAYLVNVRKSTRNYAMNYCVTN